MIYYLASVFVFVASEAHSSSQEQNRSRPGSPSPPLPPRKGVRVYYRSCVLNVQVHYIKSVLFLRLKRTPTQVPGLPRLLENKARLPLRKGVPPARKVPSKHGFECYCHRICMCLVSILVSRLIAISFVLSEATFSLVLPERVSNI